SVTINRRQYPDKTAPLPAQLLRCSMQWRGGDPPRAPPARSQTTIPSNHQTDVFSLRPLMYFLGGLDSSPLSSPAGVLSTTFNIGGVSFHPAPTGVRVVYAEG